MISEGYRALNAQLHSDSQEYGTSGRKYADAVRLWATDLGCASILDYGCGKSTLRRAMVDWPDFREYDPAVPGKDAKPQPADMVVCTDVMEHIEPQFLDEVLEDIHSLAVRGVFFVVATGPAKKVLADGTNAHKIIQDERFWLPRMLAWWEVLSFNKGRGQFMLIGKVRK